MTGHLGTRTFLLASILVVAAASSVGAQGSTGPTAAELERARAQFGEAVALAEEGRWEEAVSLFRQVVAVRRAPPVVYNLAHALFELGEFAEADVLLAEVVADSTTPASLRASAEQLRAQMERTGGRLTVRASGALDGVILLLDHQPLDPTRVGQPLLVRAGRHVATAERDGVPVARGEATVEVGGAASIALVIAAAPAEVAAAAAPPATAAEAEAAAAAAATEGPEPAPPARRWKLWVGVSAAIVAVALGVGLGVGLAGGDGGSDRYTGNLGPGVLVIP